MMLAEALNESADAHRRLADLKKRISDNARVYGKDSRPAEDPQALLHQAIEISERIRTLTLAADATAASSRLSDGTTVAEALAQRDALDRRLGLVTGAADNAADSEAIGRHVAVLDVAALRAEADRVAAQRRALDAEIQRLSWATELTVAA